MELRNTPSHFGLVARCFHWGMAVLIICMLALGLIMEGLANGPGKLYWIGLHKSTGILILTLALARLAWRFTNPVPRLPAGLPKVIYAAAHGSHFLLYACMFAMPLTGWAMSSAAGYPVSVYGLFTLPDIVPPDKALRKLLVESHQLIAYFLIGLLVLHAAAAVWHQFIRRDGVMTRMTAPALLLGFVLCLPPGAHADEALAHFVLQPEKSSIKFVATENGVPVEGEFKQFTADILFSRDHPDQSHISVEIDPASVASAAKEMADALPGAEWFDTAHFPKAVFTSTELHPQPVMAGNRPMEYYIDGTLTLHGVTKPVTLNLAFDRYDEESAVATGTATISRTAFGIGSGQWKDTGNLRDVVTVKFRIAAKKD